MVDKNRSSGNLNRVPFGFLDLVQATVQGKHPDAFSNTVSVGLNIGQFYFSQRKGVEFTSGVMSVAGNSQFIQVPNDQTWKLYSVGVRVLFTAAGGAEFAEFQVGLKDIISEPVLARRFPIADFKLVPSNHGDNDVSLMKLVDIDVLLLPGESVELLTRNMNVAAPRAVSLSLGVARMNV